MYVCMYILVYIFAYIYIYIYIYTCMGLGLLASLCRLEFFSAQSAEKLYTCSCGLSTTKSNHLEGSLTGNILGYCICERRFAWCTVRDSFQGTFFCVNRPLLLAFAHIVYGSGAIAALVSEMHNIYRHFAIFVNGCCKQESPQQPRLSSGRGCHVPIKRPEGLFSTLVTGMETKKTSFDASPSDCY
jgi:hypothetical protein